MRSPQVEAAAGLPAQVTIYEVGPRDGLQNEKTIVPAATKVRRVRAAYVPVACLPVMGLSSCNLPYGSLAHSQFGAPALPSRMQDKRQSDCILGFTDR